MDTGGASVEAEVRGAAGPGSLVLIGDGVQLR